MGFGVMVVAAGVAAGCYWGYRRLLKIEDEIRVELEEKGLTAEEGPSEAKGTPPEKLQPTTPPATPAETSLEERILEKVRAHAGLLQTELYPHFPDGERKALQSALLKMDRAGVLKRTKEKGTYRLDLP